MSWELKYLAKVTQTVSEQDYELLCPDNKFGVLYTVSSHGGRLYFQITEKYVSLIRGTVLLKKLLSYHSCKEVKLTELVEEQQSHVRENHGPQQLYLI